MTLRCVRLSSHEGHVQRTVDHSTDSLVARSLDGYKAYSRIAPAESTPQLCNKSVGNRGIKTHVQPTSVALRDCTHSFDRMVQMANTYSDFIYELPAGFRQSNTTRPPLEQEYAKLLFEHLDAGADTGLANIKSSCGVTKVQVPRDYQHLHKRSQRNSVSKLRRAFCLV